jgi:ferrous iron transport protein B
MSKVLLVGKPNSGKSLLFNRLTGLQHKVANFPGVTVQVKSGQWIGQSNEWELVDFPGTYSFLPLTQDEVVAIETFRKFLTEEDTRCVVCVLDAVQLERSLVVALQVRDLCIKQNKPVVFVLNMYDEILDQKLAIDVDGLSEDIGVPMVAASGKTRLGLDTIERKIAEAALPTKGGGFTARDLALKYGVKSDIFIRKMNRADRFFLSSFWGGLFFLLIMFVLFQAIFTWATPLMDLIDAMVGASGEFVGSLLPSGMVKDFVNDAIFGGVGTFVVFVPQIFMLTLIIGILEDSGYLARVAIICHQPLKFFGLSGKSFIPFLSGHACAIPAIYATRMIESPKKRLITILAIPLIACSARLPVYGLFIAAIIPEDRNFLIFSQRGVAFFFLFILGYVVALVVSGLYSKYIYKTKSDAPFMIELPSYRRPLVKPLLMKATSSSWNFLRDAGPTIFVASVIVWCLSYFPNGSGHLDSSWMASLGHFIEPAVKPLGLDWRYGVAILASFVAREVFVGTLGTFYGIQGAENEVSSLASKISASGLTFASGISLLVFYVVALQCVSTLAVIGRETGSKTLPVVVFFFYTLLAYVLALIAYGIMS